MEGVNHTMNDRNIRGRFKIMKQIQATKFRNRPLTKLKRIEILLGHEKSGSKDGDANKLAFLYRMFHCLAYGKPRK